MKCVVAGRDVFYLARHALHPSHRASSIMRPREVPGMRRMQRAGVAGAEGVMQRSWVASSSTGPRGERREKVCFARMSIMLNVPSGAH